MPVYASFLWLRNPYFSILICKLSFLRGTSAGWNRDIYSIYTQLMMYKLLSCLLWTIAKYISVVSLYSEIGVFTALGDLVFVSHALV